MKTPRRHRPADALPPPARSVEPVVAIPSPHRRRVHGLAPGLACRMNCRLALGAARRMGLGAALGLAGRMAHRMDLGMARTLAVATSFWI